MRGSISTLFMMVTPSCLATSCRLWPIVVALVESSANRLPQMIYSWAAVPTQTSSMDLTGCLAPVVDG